MDTQPGDPGIELAEIEPEQGAHSPVPKPTSPEEKSQTNENDPENDKPEKKADPIDGSPISKDSGHEERKNDNEAEGFMDLDSSMRSEAEFASHLGALHGKGGSMSSGISAGHSLGQSQKTVKTQWSSTSLLPGSGDGPPTAGFDGTYDPAFWKEVSRKEDLEGLQPKIAFREARLDRIIKQQGSVERALFFILRRCPLQGETRQLLDGIVSRGVDVNVREKQTLSGPLHLAAERNFVHVARLLLDNEAVTQSEGSGGKLPVEIALESKNDELAAVIMRNMTKSSVRALFEAQLAEDGTILKPALDFTDLVTSNAMPQTCKAVLDAMLESTDEPDEYRFHYRILESDPNGQTPNMPTFNQTAKTAFHRILDGKNKDLHRHNVVRMLIHNKWSAYGEKMAMTNIAMYFAFLFFVSFSLVSAARQADPRKYSGVENIFRAIFEILAVICIVLNVVEEVREMIREKLAYLKDPYNYIQLLSILLLVTIIPLRWTNINAQWHIASIAYLLLCLRALQLIAVLRIVGIYLQILTRILYKDVSRFTIIFILFLLMYTGSLLLALRGEMWSPEADEPQNGTELDIIRLTSTYPQILITGIRTMIQQESVIDYINEEDAHSSFGWLGVILNMLFLFFVLIVLLNILIAQLSDTYADVKADAQRELEQNWGVSLKNLEQSASPFKRLRFQTYSHYEDVEHPGDTLIGWEEPDDENEQEEEERRQRQFEQHIQKQQQHIMALKAQMRTAIIMLQKNEEIPPQLRTALNELVRDTLPGMLSGVVEKARVELTEHMDQHRSRNDKSFLLMHHKMGETSTSLQEFIGQQDESLAARLAELDGKLDQTAGRVDAVSSQLQERIPDLIQEIISIAHSSTIEELTDVFKSSLSQGSTSADGRTSTSSPIPGESPHIVSQVQTIISNAQVATQDGIKLAHIHTTRNLEGLLQRQQQSLAASLTSTLVTQMSEMRKDLMKEISDEFERRQLASDAALSAQLQALAEGS